MTTPATHAPLVQAEILPEAADRLAHERACAAHLNGMHLAIIAIDCLEPGILTSAEVERSRRALRKIVRGIKSRKTHHPLVNESALMQREATGQSSWRQIVDQAIDAQALLVLHEALRGLSVLDILDAAELGQFDILLRRIAERLVSEQRKAHGHHAPVIEREHVRLADDDEPIPDRARPTAGSPPGQERWTITREMLNGLRAAPLRSARGRAMLRELADHFEGADPPASIPEAAERLGVSERQLWRWLDKLGGE